ncbi:uncharacterized protein LOC120176677 [Hibiscus syriacus]|uniref:uncharacterized protein LOC120176677 n=1 Tax=Hibiscus syriacus TaxID=106335 RepID=UPI001921B938|nr:uncharacterized protein LOC120176677 [Hibiscus syriacus]
MPMLALQPNKPHHIYRRRAMVMIKLSFHRAICSQQQEMGYGTMEHRAGDNTWYDASVRHSPGVVPPTRRSRSRLYITLLLHSLGLQLHPPPLSCPRQLLVGLPT